MDEATFKQELRDELAIPTAGLDTAQRVAALEAAFQPWKYARPGSALTQLTVGDLVDYFGPITLRKAFGGEIERYGPGPNRFHAQDWKVGLRRRAYRYAVVGFKSRAERDEVAHRAVALALRLNPQILFGEATDLLDPSVENMKLRAGLLNKVQSHLLADQLNQRQNNVLSWRVVDGPAPDSSARVWLDALSPVAPLLRRESGETGAWGLGTVAQHEIAVFRLENGLMLSPSQVFSVQSPRVVPPPRFQLECRDFPANAYMPYGSCGLAAQRAEESEEARRLCTLITHINLVAGKHWDDLPPRTGFVEGVKGFIDDAKVDADYGAFAYSNAFDQQEAEIAVRHLRALGYGEFVPQRLGEDIPMLMVDSSPMECLTNVDGLPCGIHVFFYR
jgi:hypothetical protein